MMKNCKVKIFVCFFLLFTILCSACSSCGDGSSSGEDSGTATSGDSDSDSDADTDADNDSDTDTDGDSDTDIDGDTDVDSDSDSDGDADSDVDSDSDSDTDLGLPEGCQLLSPANANGYGWTGSEAMHNDHIAWRWIEHSTSPSQIILMVRELSTQNQKELIRREYPDTIDRPTIYGGNIYFERETSASDALSREIFSIGVEETTETQLTQNEAADATAKGGSRYVVYTSIIETDELDKNRLIYYDSVNKTNTIIHEDMGLIFAYNGARWVAFMSDNQLYKYDIEHPENGYELIHPEKLGVFYMSFDKATHELITGIYINGVTNRYDLYAWDMETNTYTILVDDPLDQLLPDYHGHIVGYVDSQEAGVYWFSSNSGDVRIIDRETKEKRIVLPLDTYYGLSIWSHYLAVNNVGRWGDSLILCDLKEGGFVDDAGHVIPDGAGMDGGIDSGAK